MPLGGRGGRGTGSGAPRLLLDMPGEPPSAALPTVWRCVLSGPEGDRGPEAVLAVAKAPTIAGRTERALVAALARDRLAELVDLAGSDHDLSDVARLFLGLRQAGSDPMGASRALIAVLDADPAPWEHRLVRRRARPRGLRGDRTRGAGGHAGGPRGDRAAGVRAAHRHRPPPRRAALLDNLPPTAAVVLALAAVHLASGRHELAVDVTAALPTPTTSAPCAWWRGRRAAGGRPFRRRAGLPRPGHGRPDRHPGIIVARWEAGRPAPARGRRPRRAGRHRPHHPARRRGAGRRHRPHP